MSATSINHVNIRSSVELMHTLRDFYCAALGLQVGARPAFASLGFWLYSDSHALIHLSVTRDDEIRSPHLHTTLDHIAFQCENQTAMCEKLRAMGVEFTADRVPGSPIYQVFFSDPAGNGVELCFIANE